MNNARKPLAAILVVLCLGAAGIAAPVTAQTNLIVNGGFESPALGSGWQVFSSIPGWTTTVGPGIELQDWPPPMPFAGNQVVELDSYGNSGMQQIVPTTAGQSYTLSFMYSPRPHVGAGSNGIEVRINGAVIDTITGDGTALSVSNWKRFNYPVVAIGATMVVEFRATGTDDTWGGFLDEVSFVALVAVPTMSQTGLIALAGLLLLAGAAALSRRVPA